METLNLNTRSLIGAFIVSSLLLAGCSKDSQLGDVKPSSTESSIEHSNLKKATSGINYIYTNSPTEAVEACGEKSITDFVSNNNKTGTLEISNDADHFYVDVKSIEGLTINSLKLYVGNLASVPLNNGENPKLGHYPIKTETPEGSSHLQYKFAKAELGDAFIVSAKAEISGLDSWATETAFSSNNNSAGYVSYTTQECSTPRSAEVAYRAWSFDDHYNSPQSLDFAKVFVSNDNENIYFRINSTNTGITSIITGSTSYRLYFGEIDLLPFWYYPGQTDPRIDFSNFPVRGHMGRLGFGTDYTFTIPKPNNTPEFDFMLHLSTYYNTNVTFGTSSLIPGYFYDTYHIQ